MRTTVSSFIVIAWIAWFLTAWLVLGATLGFGHVHEILAVAAVCFAVPPILLLMQRVMWSNPPRSRTVMATAAVAAALYVLVAVAALMGWVGVEAQ